MKRIAWVALGSIALGLAAYGAAVAGPVENAEEAVQTAIQEAEQASVREPSSPDIEMQGGQGVVDPNTGTWAGPKSRQDEEDPSKW